MKKDKLLVIPWTIVTLNLFLFVGYSTLIWFSFDYPYVEDWGLLLQLLLYCNIPALLAAGYIPLYIFFRRWLKKWMRVTLTCAISALIIFVSLSSFRLLFLMSLTPPFASKTENIDNYLKLDRYFEDGLKDSIFPISIPESATNMHYFYRFRDTVEEDYDIYLRVTLSEVEFQKEKTRIVTNFPEAEIVETESGAVEYRIAYIHQGIYYYNFVSFSEADLTVTYVIAYSLEGESVGNVPYFMEIEEGGAD